MYSHVCENGGTREVLLPRPLNRSRLRIYVEYQYRLTLRAVGLRLQQKQGNTIGVDVDDRGRFHGIAQDCTMSGYYHIADSRRTLFIQVKAEHIAPRAHVCLCPFCLSFVLREPPSFLHTFAIEYTLALV